MGSTTAAPPTPERLTTGVAARLLGCSRQHVADLCEKGLLPFTTVGTHRRVLRSDVESLRARTDQPTRDQRRSLYLAFAVAGKVAADPSRAAEVGRRNIAKMRPVARGGAHALLDEWQRLLDGPVGELLVRLVDPSPHGRDMRQMTPFAGLLSEDERLRALAAWRASDSGASAE
ncbi:helix-turn-helix domain-containing protein [Acidimicrobiia bacterium EGI L10123]|uniref:helix-turn-helix domain-containing protein n=1 Tax=Salinilacustrithrix flava TaxID=2957203 RepID=UPI003D7C20B6|nr:helix-turn-helix domain-containing protein [Acidimicrobiia bacterium EGI L10123]